MIALVSMSLAVVQPSELTERLHLASQQGGQTAAVVYSVGRCLASRSREASAALLNVLPLGGGEIHPAQKEMINSVGCAGSSVPDDSAFLLRGGIAQALYNADFEEFGVAPRNRPEWVNLRLPVEAEDTAGSKTDELYKWGDCVVRNDTQGVEALLRTPAGSRREAMTLGRMQPYMAACLSEGKSLAVAPYELRSLFAQAAYHSLYRYWSGELRQASAGGEAYEAYAGPNTLGFVRCERFKVVSSRVRTHRYCMSERDWRTANLRLRAWMHEATSTGLQK